MGQLLGKYVPTDFTLKPIIDKFQCIILVYLLLFNFEDTLIEKNHSLVISLKYIL